MRDSAKDEGKQWGWVAAGTERQRLEGSSVSYLKSRSLNERGHAVHVVNIKQTDDRAG